MATEPKFAVEFNHDDDQLNDVGELISAVFFDGLAQQSG